MNFATGPLNTKPCFGLLVSLQTVFIFLPPLACNKFICISTRLYVQMVYLYYNVKFAGRGEAKM